MKYKNINTAIHNLGHSFISDMNHVDDVYIIDELRSIQQKGYDIQINWLNLGFNPIQMKTKKIEKSILYYSNKLEKQFSMHNVEFERIKSLLFIWKSEKNPYMLALDDRGKEYNIQVIRT